jgi:DNA-binding SARP family transcriptional activator
MRLFDDPHTTAVVALGGCALGALWLVLRCRKFERWLEEERNALEEAASAAVAKVDVAADVQGLPSPVQRFFERTLGSERWPSK